MRYKFLSLDPVCFALEMHPLIQQILVSHLVFLLRTFRILCHPDEHIFFLLAQAAK
jgi:hypothetical protein